MCELYHRQKLLRWRTALRRGEGSGRGESYLFELAQRTEERCHLGDVELVDSDVDVKGSDAFGGRLIVDLAEKSSQDVLRESSSRVKVQLVHREVVEITLPEIIVRAYGLQGDTQTVPGIALQ